MAKTITKDVAGVKVQKEGPNRWLWKIHKTDYRWTRAPRAMSGGNCERLDYGGTLWRSVVFGCRNLCVGYTMGYHDGLDSLTLNVKDED